MSPRSSRTPPASRLMQHDPTTRTGTRGGGSSVSLAAQEEGACVLICPASLDSTEVNRGGGGGGGGGNSRKQQQGGKDGEEGKSDSSRATAVAVSTTALQQRQERPDSVLYVAAGGPVDDDGASSCESASDEPVARPQALMQRIFTIAVSGTGFLADSYDIFVINLVLLFMKENPSYGVLTPPVQARVSMMAILGALTGQILFGVLGDQFGRRTTFLITALLTIVGNILQATAQPMQHFNIYTQMAIYRFVMGIGVGGEYPAASTITSENSTALQRDRNLAAVFSMQGFGRLLCALVLLCCAYFVDDPDLRWRVAIMVGAIPMLAAIFFRWLPETETYRHQVQLRYPNLRERFATICRTVWENRKKLAGTAGSWFLLDVLFYGNSLFSADVVQTVDFGKSGLRGLALANLVIQLIALPGYILAILLIDRVGRKRLQLLGFAGEAIIFGYMAVNQRRLKQTPVAFVLMYSLSFLLDNFGANTTIPAVIYPTEARASCHGISAAFGKAGAALGAAVFLRLVNSPCPGHVCTKESPPEAVDRGVKLVFYWCFVLAIVGFTWTSVLVRDRPHRSLDMTALELEKGQEQAKGKAKAESRGRERGGPTAVA